MTARVITVTSGKGGVGKTTATANIAVALASSSQKVTCIDADIGLRNLDVVMGLENRIVYDLERLMTKKENSADQAKERLKLVLIHDRTDLTPGLMEKLKNDLLEVIGRYVEIDPNAVRIDMAKDGREHKLVADIPLITPSARKRRTG